MYIMLYHPFFLSTSVSCGGRNRSETLFFSCPMLRPIQHASWATPLKNMSSSIGMMNAPIFMGKCQIHGCSKAPTRNILKKKPARERFFQPCSKPKSRKYSEIPGIYGGTIISLSSSHPGATFHHFCISLGAQVSVTPWLPAWWCLHRPRSEWATHGGILP